MNYFLPLRKYFRLYTEIVDILNNLKKKMRGLSLTLFLSSVVTGQVYFGVRGRVGVGVSAGGYGENKNFKVTK